MKDQLKKFKNSNDMVEAINKGEVKTGESVILDEKEETLSDYIDENMIDDFHAKNFFKIFWTRINERTKQKGGVSPRLSEIREILKKTFGDKLIE